MNIRTDLALEAHEAILSSAEEEEAKIEGIDVSEYESEGFKITKVDIKSDRGSRLLSKEKGSYITLEAPELRSKKSEIFENVANALAGEIRKLLTVGENEIVLVAGLGNRRITPDALGPKVIENLMVTKHLIEYVPEYFSNEFRPVCAISPGVLGITGIETSEIIKGVVQRVKPAAVILIDALAARKMSRLVTTFQLSDTGIEPGGGVGNTRSALGCEYLGTKVMSIGVPTVVDAATLASDVICGVLEKGGEHVTNYFGGFVKASAEEQEEILKGMLSPFQSSLLVTPKEIDDLTDQSAKIIGYALNLALHKNIDFDDINTFLE